MVKQMSIVLPALLSFLVAYGSVPRYVQAPKSTIIEPEKDKPAAEEKKAQVAPEKEQAVIPAAPAAPAATIDEMNIDLSAESRVAICALLNTLLADEYVLYVKTQNFHWNIKNSMNFNDLHLFFGKIYAEVACTIDMVAERVRALGGAPFGSMSEFIKNARLKEEDGAVASDKEMIKKLLDDSEAIIRSLRANIQKTAELNDMGTNNMLADLIAKHEKTAWMLRSYLK